MSTPRDPVSPLQGANVVVGVAGGIAAYKAAELVRLLIKAGATVRVCMTARAREFVGPLTFQALTGHPVFTDLFSLTEEANIGHIQVADDADLVIVAPATASTMARLAAGQADDALTSVVLATKAPVLLAPSMNVNMWSHPLTQANVTRLREVAGYHTVGPGDGFLACQWIGPGRLAEPAEIVEAATTLLSPKDLAGRRVVVSAGPTFEAIDPVRFVGNRSSGKMGYALALAARRRGATVTLVSGPSALVAPLGVEVVAVESAAQMQAAIDVAARGADAVIMAAAVADFRPREVATGKLKRGAIGARWQLELAQNPDILAGLGKRRGAAKRPLLVGFAAETDGESLEVLARGKLTRKACDLVVGNDVSAAGAGFEVDTNRVVVVGRSAGDATWLDGSKLAVAHGILDRLVALTAPAPKPRRAR